MKTKSIAVFIFLVSLVFPLKSQKPMVEVTFAIQEGTPFYFRYEDQLGVLQSGILDSLIQGLNRNLAFVQFDKVSSNAKLNIILDAKFRGSSNTIKDHYLVFEFVLDQSPVNKDQCLVLDFAHYSALGEEPQEIIAQVSQVWNSYLVSHYRELVDKMFRRLSVSLSDPKQIIIDSQVNKWEAVLPLSKESLSLDPDLSRFSVRLDFKEENGTTTTKIQDNIAASGDLDQNITIGTKSLKGCLRLGLQPLPSLTVGTGKVFITQYERKIYSLAANPDDFINGQ